MKTNLLRFTIAIGCLFFISISSTGCEPAQVPSYLKIDTIMVDSVDYTEYGSHSSRVEFAYIYLDDNFIGAYKVPCNIPVLTEGNKKFQIYGGVAENSRELSDENDIVRYVFYSPYEIIIPMVKEDTSTIFPHIQIDTVQDATVTYFDLNAEVNTFDLIDPAGDHLKELAPANNGTFGGANCMKLSLINESERNLSVITVGSINVPNSDRFFYLEFDMKGNAAIALYLRNPVTGAEVRADVIKATSTWKHFYLRISDEVAQLNSNLVQLKITVAKGDDFPFNEEIYLDNFRVMSN